MLDEITEQQRAEAVTFYQGCRNVKTGWFIDPLLKPADRVRVHHSVYLSKDAHPIGDTMGTRMCLNTLSMIDRSQS